MLPTVAPFSWEPPPWLFVIVLMVSPAGCRGFPRQYCAAAAVGESDQGVYHEDEAGGDGDL